MTKQQIVDAKKHQLQNDLSTWMRKCDHFSAGDIIELTMTLVETTPVTTIIKGAYTLKPDCNERYYKCLYSNLTESDWELILNCPMPRAQLSGLHVLRKRNNRATSTDYLEEGTCGFRTKSVDLFLRKAGLNFRFMRVARDNARRTNLYQLFAVKKIK